MPSLRVPNELLETIFDLVHDKTAEPIPESQQTFASLAFTSKLFLPLARSYLYYRPICPSSPVSWIKAISLATSISSPLGQLVVSLEGIVEFVVEIVALDEPSIPLPFQLRGHTKAFSLYHKLLSCCPRLVFVDIICNSKKHLAKLVDALKDSLSTLKTVKFVNPVYSNAYCITGGTLDEALYRFRPGNVEEIILFDVEVSELSGDPRGPLALQSFSIQLPLNTFSHYKPLLPRDSSSLSSISLENTMLSDSELIWILNYLPSTLRQVALNASNEFAFGHLRDYQRPMHPSLPPLKFARFTSLTHVSLMNFCGPSLALLRSLSSSSPNISVLCFASSYWVTPSSSPSTSLPIVDDSIPSLLDPDALLSHLLQFKRLKWVHLGWLPTKKRESFRAVEEEMKEKRGVKVEWDVCY